MLNTKLDSLQALRAVAVCLVVFTHIHVGADTISNNNQVYDYYNLRHWGAIGVDLFFAISGFIMILIIPKYQNRGGWKLFFLKRIIRIVPLYYLVSIFEFLRFYLKHGAIAFAKVLKSIVLLPVIKGSLLLGVAWTLAYEIYFYLLITLILFVAIKKAGNSILLLLAILPLIGLVFKSQAQLLNFLFNPLLLEFGLGAAAGLYYRSAKYPANKKYKLYPIMLTTLGLLLIIIRIFYNPQQISVINTVFTDDSNVYRVILNGIPCTIFLLGSVLSAASFKYRIPKIFVLIGDASYSCYLLHTFIYALVGKIISVLNWGLLPYYIIVMPICLVISFIFYKWVEKPITKYLNAKLPTF